MTKDLRNQGLDDVTVTNNGATFNSEGKLGGCYSFNGSTSYINTNIDIPNFALDKTYSITCWVCPSGVSGKKPIIGIGPDWSWTIFQQDTDLRFVQWDSGGSRWGDPAISGVFGANTWVHIGVIWNHGVLLFYKNGEKIYEWTAPTSRTVKVSSDTVKIGGNIYAWGSNYFNGKLNDVRIYDHALSPMEVKQLSQGLVLHYSLADAYIEDTTNLNTKVNMNTSTNSVWGGHSTTTTIYDCTNEPVPFNSGNKIEITYPVGSSTGGGTSVNLGIGIPVASSTVYTLSVYLKASDNFSYWTPNFIYYYGDSAGHGIFNINNKEYIANGWYRIWGTLTTGSSQTSLNPYFYSYPGTNKTYYIGGWQLEQKDHMTPFVSFGTNRDNSTVYDCSGFCNNGTIFGELAISDNTPKYKVSTHFSSAQIRRDSLEGEIKTLACWVKTTASKSTSQFVVADYNSGMCISFYSGCIIGVFGTTRSTGSRSTLGSTYKENDWNHIVVVKTGDTGERAIYCNGELLTPTTNDYWSAAAGFLVSGRNTSNTLPMQGYISDVRAYATALSASDVKSLYQNCATIDPDGTIRGQIRS